MAASHRQHTEERDNILRLHSQKNISSKSPIPQGGTVRCWNCEEEVHRLAESCPYCQKSLQVFHISPEDKVEATLYAVNEPLEIQDKVQQEASTSLSVLLIALSTLSCAGVLILLTALIWIFGDGKTFTLEWPQEIWRTFGAIGLLLLVIGSYAISKTE